MKLTPESVEKLSFTKVAFIASHAIPIPESRLETVGETVVAEILEILKSFSLKPAPKVQPYKDEEWSITWSSNTSKENFSLDIQKGLVGSQFNYCTSKFAHPIIEKFSNASLAALGNRPARGFLYQYEIEFLLPDGLNNRELVVTKLIPNWEDSCLAKWTNAEKMARFDIKLGSMDQDFQSFLSLEFPGNEDYRTVWAKFTIQQSENSAATTNVELINRFNEASEEFRKNQIGPLLIEFLGDIDLEYLEPR